MLYHPQVYKLCIENELMIFRKTKHKQKLSRRHFLLRTPKQRQMASKPEPYLACFFFVKLTLRYNQQQKIDLCKINTEQQFKQFNSFRTIVPVEEHCKKGQYFCVNYFAATKFTQETLYESLLTLC